MNALPCRRCAKPLKIVSRGLCSTCYRKERIAGRLDFWSKPITRPEQAITEACRKFGIDIVEFAHGESALPRAWAAQQVRDIGFNSTETANFFGVARSTIDIWWGKDATPPPPPWPEQKWTACAVCGKEPIRSYGLCSGHTMRFRRTKRVDPDRPLRPLNQTERTEACSKDARGYRYGCRCEDCRRAATRRKKWTRYLGGMTTDLTEVREHITRLRAAGMEYAQIDKAAGLPSRRTYAWHNGRNQRAYAESVNAVLSVPVPCVDCGEPSLANGRWCYDCFRNTRSA